MTAATPWLHDDEDGKTAGTRSHPIPPGTLVEVALEGGEVRRGQVTGYIRGEPLVRYAEDGPREGPRCVALERLRRARAAQPPEAEAAVPKPKPRRRKRRRATR